MGIIYGEPLANILHVPWQETFLALGYIGLILIIFEGGLTTRLDLLKKYFTLSMCAAATGVLVPLAFTYLLLFLGFGYGAVETFIIGAALSATSLGTTFAVISSASKSVDLAQTRVGTVLVSAAVIDDITGLVMSSVIHDLGQLSSGSSVNLGWLIGRPIVASAAMAMLTPLLTKYLFAPVFRKFVERRFARYDHFSNIIMMILVLSAFISIASYAGTSVLFGAFLAGTFLTYLPSKHEEGPFTVMSREHGENDPDKSPTFVHTFERYLLDVQLYLMSPLFFASIGFAIPFLSLWTGQRIWRGIVYTLLMVVAKAVVGIWVPLWDWLTPGGNNPKRKRKEEQLARAQSSSPTRSDNDLQRFNTEERRLYDWRTIVPSSLLLGAAMVARGEIGLLIVQIGFNDTTYVSEDGFVTAVWAILLNTIIGPVIVGLLVKYRGKEIGEGAWGLEVGGSEDPASDDDPGGANGDIEKAGPPSQ